MMERKRVKDYMTYDVITVNAGGTVRDVTETIKRHINERVPVVG